MFVCEKNASCCNYQYADRLDQIDEEFRNSCWTRLLSILWRENGFII